MIVRKYETLFIVKPDLDESAMKAVKDRVTGIVTENDGIEICYQDWGKKRLAYPIHKHSKGVYMYYRYLGLGHAVNELERHMKVMDNVLRYMTVKLEDRVDSEEFDVEADRKSVFPFGVKPREDKGRDSRRSDHRQDSRSDKAPSKEASSDNKAEKPKEAEKAPKEAKADEEKPETKKEEAKEAAPKEAAPKADSKEDQDK